MNRRDALRRIFAIGASFTAAGLLVRQEPARLLVDYQPVNIDELSRIVKESYSGEFVERFYAAQDTADAMAWASNVTDRKVPPGYEFYYDPKALRRFELRDDDYIYLANGAPSNLLTGESFVDWAARTFPSRKL